MQGARAFLGTFTRRRESEQLPGLIADALRMGGGLLLLVLEQSAAHTGYMFAALFANVILVVTAFVGAPALLGYVGEEATKAVAKIASLFLAALAVAMIRASPSGMIGGGRRERGVRAAPYRRTVSLANCSPAMPVSLHRALLVGAFLLFATSACTPSGALTGEGTGEEASEEVDLSQYEDFDPAPYREEAPAAEEEDVEHDVPSRLLSGDAAAGIERTVQGYRVQVLSSKDQGAAESAAGEAQQWWRDNQGAAPDGLFVTDEGLPVYTVYRQPFYRVRVGNFTSRAEAERALEFLQQRYGDAFIARSEVTVTQ